ncbi:MAG: class II fructose-bisphosphate aldolase [Dorea sp.]|nr:class II fructose-bisphosphate aldolase [Dorea sp.]
MESNRFIRVLSEARQTGKAIAAINILNYNTGSAVVLAAHRANRPVILQPSVGTVRRYGVETVAGMTGILREMTNVPVVLHLDHCMDEDLAFACIRAGWDSVMVDYSGEDFQDNVERTKRAVEYAHSYGAAVEGEIGVISGVEDEIVKEKEHPASLEETIRYLQETQVDAIAPAIGTAHGQYKEPPRLNFELVEKLRGYNVPIVVHGGTGLSEGDFRRLTACGAAKINISTALKKVYLDSARSHLGDTKISPLEFDRRVEEACSEEMEKFIRLFANEDIRI